MNQVACALLRLGFKSGDRLGIWSPNCAEWALTQFATHKIGVILVNMSPVLPPHRIGLCHQQGIVPRLGDGHFIQRQRLRSHVGRIGTRIGRTQHRCRVTSRSCPEFAPCHPHRWAKPAVACWVFADLLAEPSSEELAQLAEIGRELQFDQAINIQFTSGTTGSPKGTMLTHHNILNNGYFVGETMEVNRTRQGVYPCALVPLFWHGDGQFGLHLSRFGHGVSIVGVQSFGHFASHTR